LGVSYQFGAVDLVFTAFSGNSTDIAFSIRGFSDPQANAMVVNLNGGGDAEKTLAKVYVSMNTVVTSYSPANCVVQVQPYVFNNEREPVSGEYIKSLFSFGSLTVAVSDYVIASCSSPTSNQFTSAVCTSGSMANAVQGTDTVIVNCGIFTGLKYYTSACVSGDMYTVGV